MQILIPRIFAAEGGVISGYYSKVYALTPVQDEQITTTGVKNQDKMESILSSPNFLLVLMGIFIFLLSAAIILQAVNKVLDFKRTMMTLMVCLMIISVPLLLRNTLYSTFQLRAGSSEIPKNIILEQTSPTGIMITWETQEERTGAVRYGKAPLVMTESRIEIANEGKLTKSHQVEIDRLEKSVEYEVEFLSGKSWYDDNSQPLKFILK